MDNLLVIRIFFELILSNIERVQKALGADWEEFSVELLKILKQFEISRSDDETVALAEKIVRLGSQSNAGELFLNIEKDAEERYAEIMEAEDAFSPTSKGYEEEVEEEWLGRFEVDGPVLYDPEGTAEVRSVSEKLYSEIKNSLFKRLASSFDEDKKEPTRKARYANHFLMNMDNDAELPQAPLPPGSNFRLRIDIGKLKDTYTQGGVPIPEDKLESTGKDIDLEVMVSSNDFEFLTETGEKKGKNAALGRLTLPKDGGPALTPEDNEYLYFLIRAPKRAGKARARIGYYYRNFLIQMYLLNADIGTGEGAYEFDCDYTLSETLSNVQKIEVLPARDHISIFVNDEEQGDHTFIVKTRKQDGVENEIQTTYKMEEGGLNVFKDNFRDLMWDKRKIKTNKSNNLVSSTKKFDIDDLKRDLHALANLGKKLKTVFTEDIWNWVVSQQTQPTDKEILIDIARPSQHSFSFPWQFIYDIPLRYPEEEHFCDIVDKLTEIIDPDLGLTNCPYQHKHREGTLCPFGFWGFRYKIQQRAGKSKDLVTKVSSNKLSFLFSNTKDRKFSGLIDRHKDNLGSLINKNYGEYISADCKRDVLAKMGLFDLPIAYFYCHGYREEGFEETTYLCVGDNEKISVDDFETTYYLEWLREYKKTYKQKTKTLVFINACHSLEIKSETLGSFLEAFLETEYGSGVIGTEVSVDAELASEFSEIFFQYLLDANQQYTVSEALHRTRMQFLAKNSIFGLVYTPYCSADLELSIQQ